MLDIKKATADARAAMRHAWVRLSVTQQLMLRGLGLFTAMAVLAGLVGASAPNANLSTRSEPYNGTAIMPEHLRLRGSLDTSSGELELVRLRLARAEALLRYSARYRVPADLAALVYDMALQEGIDPELGFRLVNVESGFEVRARSRANAYGLAQVQLATARFYERDITVERLYEPERNLRIGFRFLRDLMETYGDVNLALLVYNRGPTRVKSLMDAGRDPDNGYPRTLMEGYSGAGN